MKLKHILTFSLVSCLVGPHAIAQNNAKSKSITKASSSIKSVKNKTVSKTDIQPSAKLYILQNAKDSLSYALGVDVAKSMKSAGFDLNVDVFSQGFRSNVNGDSILFSDDQISEIIQAGVKGMVEKRNEELSKEGKDFLAKNGLNPNVMTLENGLQYEILREGAGEKPSSNDEVIVHYEGTLANGEKFDSSYDRNSPLTLSLNSVIEAWKIGIPMMNVGAKYKFYVPHELGYGGRASGPIPAFSTLIFTVELLDIKK